MLDSRKSVRSLFVYGTLAPGQPNEHILKPIRGTWRRGTVKGFLHERGWAAGQGYFGIELDRRGSEVQGQVFNSPGLVNYWETLDKFEGEDYRRVLTEVTLSNGKILKAYIYELQKF